jgi:hypothetical protein
MFLPKHLDEPDHVHLGCCVDMSGCDAQLLRYISLSLLLGDGRGG